MVPRSESASYRRWVISEDAEDALIKLDQRFGSQRNRDVRTRERSVSVGSIDLEDAPIPEEDNWKSYGFTVILGSSFSLLFLLDGSSFNFGLIFLGIIKKFSVDRAAAGLVAALFQASPQLLSPVVTPICEKVGCRLTIMIGGMISFAGLLVAYFATDYYTFLLGFGIILGTGYSLLYTAAAVMLNLFFKKRIGLAIALSSAGSSLGTFVFPAIVEAIMLFWNREESDVSLASIAVMTIFATVFGMTLRNVRYLSGTVEFQEKRFAKMVSSHTRSRQQDIATNAKIHRSGSLTNITFEDDSGKIKIRESPLNSRNGKYASAPQLSNMETHHKKNPAMKMVIDMRIAITEQVAVYNIVIANMQFVKTALSTVLLYTIIEVFYISFVDHSVTTLNIPEEHTMYLVSVIGLSSLITTFIVAVVADRPFFKRNMFAMHSLSMVAIALSLIGACFASNYLQMAVLSAMFGIFITADYSLQTALVHQLFTDIKQINCAHSLITFGAGIGSLVGPILMGELRELTGSYTVVFCISAFLAVISASLTFSVHLERRRNLASVLRNTLMFVNRP